MTIIQANDLIALFKRMAREQCLFYGHIQPGSRIPFQ